MPRRANSAQRRRDAYYTPEGLADELVNAASITPRSVMDPAVGDGALLRAASSRWPEAHLFGLDVDRSQLDRTRSNHPDWTLGRMDMFSERSRSASPQWGRRTNEIDLMVLNPPFSYRGGQSVRGFYNGADFALTPASAFTALAVDQLSPNGELLALLPAGVLDLERDARFWASLAEKRPVETVAQFSSTAFSGTRTRSVLVAIRPVGATHGAEVIELPSQASTCVELVRGRVPVHAVAREINGHVTAPFLHTRDLAKLTPNLSTGVTASASLATMGPLVTLPRVGRVRAEHIKLVDQTRPVVLSDCVFALRTANSAELRALRDLLFANLDALQREYVGACAPYLTIRRLRQFLRQRGYCCHHVPASRSIDASQLAQTLQCPEAARSS